MNYHIWANEKFKSKK